MSAGTMSNLSFGGSHRGTSFTSYETIPGGAGASAQRAGRAAIQTHMTNTRNTPIEEIEHRFPVRVVALSVRRGSGGRGARRGGDGVVKVLEARGPLSVSFLGERHRRGPQGLAGGGRWGARRPVEGTAREEAALAGEDHVRTRGGRTGDRRDAGWRRPRAWLTGSGRGRSSHGCRSRWPVRRWPRR
jgi:N-methylhydantoinase B